MTRPVSVTTAVEQAWFRLGVDGTITTVASSFGDEHAERGWLDLVGPHIGFPGDFPPAAGPAVSYLVFPAGFAAVLYRVRESTGATVAHGLLGRADELTAPVALSTVDWSGWLAMPASTRLTRLRVDDVGAPSTTGRLRQRAIVQGNQLARVLAWLLQAPAASIGILGCAEQDRPALVLALAQLAAPLLPARTWTFATQPDAATDGTTPEIAFFADAPADAAGRLLIDTRRGQGASPQNEYRANALVYRYEYGVDPPNAAAAPAQLSVPPPVPEPLQPLPVPQAVASTAVVPPWRATALARDLAGATSATEVNGALVELEYAVSRIDDRDTVRRALANEGWAERAIRRHVPFAQREAVYVRAATIAFCATGPGRVTPGAREDARRLVTDARSADLVRAVALVSQETGVSALLAERWLREHEPVAPDPLAGLGPIARFWRRAGLPVTPMIARVTVVLVILAVGIVLGWWAAGELR
ncbi:hypothetical protein [Actinophytocola sediminis]